MPIRAANPRLVHIRPRICALLIAALLIIQPAIPLRAQAGVAPPKGLQIMILDGEGALNNIRERTAREPIVQVQDENHKPVAGALILFTVHGGSSGASATFANGLTTLSVTSDAEGKAVARGLENNQTAGAWQIAVTATFGALNASMVINESNFSPGAQEPPGENSIQPVTPVHVPWYLSKPVMILGGAIVAGTVIGVVAATAGHGTTINLGTSTVGAPAVAPGVRFSFGRH